MNNITLASLNRECFLFAFRMSFVGSCALLLTACSSVQNKPDEAVKNQIHVVPLIRPLPKNADLSRRDEQAYWNEKGFYITTSGKYEPLPNDSQVTVKDSVPHKKSGGRPEIRVEKAEKKQATPIVIKLPD